jgi:hypothetical protein
MPVLSEVYKPQHAHFDAYGIHHRIEQENSFPKSEDTPKLLFQHLPSASGSSAPCTEHKQIIRKGYWLTHVPNSFSTEYPVC